MGRFINADVYAATGQGLLGNNMFAYCGNNPIMCYDPSGKFYVATCYGDINLLNRDLSDFGGGGGGRTSSNRSAVGTLAGAATTITVAVNLDDWFNEIKSVLTKSLAKAKSRDYRTEFEEHHIAARRAYKAAEAAAILNNVLPGGAKDPLNKVMLKTSIHRRIHTDLYYSVVNCMIIKAYHDADGDPSLQYANVVSTLGTLQGFLSALNALSIN